MNAAMYVLLILAVLLANWPFVSTRWFGLVNLKQKYFVHHLAEWLIGYLLVGILAYVLESRLGSVHQQGVIFFVVTVLLFVIFAFPGFVWRYFWLRKHQG